TDVNHEAGKDVAVAHTVDVEPASRLAKVISGNQEAAGKKPLAVSVNSSHHQSAAVIGDGLRVVARSPQDKVIEAIEGTSPDHFVIAVQWHPERSFDTDPASKALFEQ